MVLEAQKEPKEYAYIVNLLNYLKLAFTFNPLEIMSAQNSLKIGFSLSHTKNGLKNSMTQLKYLAFGWLCCLDLVWPRELFFIQF